MCSHVAGLLSMHDWFFIGTTIFGLIPGEIAPFILMVVTPKVYTPLDVVGIPGLGKLFVV